jgi:tetratricopeptide (TPR) repeat protein
MKNFIRISFIVLISIIFLDNSYSQKYLGDPKYGADSAARKECAANHSIMGQFVKIKLYDEAYAGWRYTFTNCPESKKNVYIHGEKIIEHKIKNASSEEVKNMWIDTLMILYNQRIEYFGQKGYVRGKQGIDLLRYRPADVQQAYSYLKEGIEEDGERTKAAVFATFMQASNALYKSGAITPDVFIADYLTTTDLLAKGRQDNNTTRALESAEKIFAESGAADCEMLVKIFTPKYEATPEDVELLKKITSLLNNGDCQRDDLFAKASESLFAVEPSASAAYNLARLFYTRDEFEKAKEYYLKAIESEMEDDEAKATYNVELAQVLLNKLNDKTGARKHARAAIALKDDMGQAYILIGNAYAGSANECGSSPFEKATVYWAAVDKYQKAKAVDASVTEKANELINQYKAYFPGKEDAFFQGLNDGDSYTVGCWINEVTVVRTR